MPSAAARRMYEDQIPPFMTVFDIDADTMVGCETVTLVDSKLVDLPSKPPALAEAPQPDLDVTVIQSDPTHKHHDGPRTHISESTDSSPTTTLSTADSSPLSDPSPSSSPESPVNLIPLNNYPSTSFGCQAGYGVMLSIPESGTLDRPMTSPAPRRPRNTKGLSIQPPAALSAASKTCATEPSSPSFIKPKIPAMRRKPSQLSLKTNTSDLVSKASSEMPPSPAMPPILQRRALKHSTSSPQIAVIRSPAFGPLGGMSFSRVLERNESGLSEVLRPMRSSVDVAVNPVTPHNESPIRTQHAHRSDFEACQESANNEDLKSPSYPNGPVAIYDDRVFLYSEPTVEEASRFDVVINVAREVRNPFDALAQPRQPAATRCGWSPPPPPSGESPVPDTAVTTASFATAFEFQPPDDRPPGTPATPKAAPTKMPEYMHVPWDHNSDIASDLMRLCEIIESRTAEGKKVLVHCQQGASRSASLIIAYGLYQNPDLSVNDAYYAAQAKSRWISPNMKLMYSLQDFHKELRKKRLSPMSTLRPKAGRSPTKHRLTLSVDAMDVSKEPQTAPLPGEGDRFNDGAVDGGSPRRGLGIQSLSPGPASAPLTCSWSSRVEEGAPPSSDGPKPHELPQRPQSDAARTGRFTTDCDAERGGVAGRAAEIPALLSDCDRQRRAQAQLRFAAARGDDGCFDREITVAPEYPVDEALMSPRVEAMTGNPLHSFSEVAGLRFRDSPATPTADLFSPREAIFAGSSLGLFGRAATFGRPSQVADPRSPPTRGEVPIIRSIDDVI